MLTTLVDNQSVPSIIFQLQLDLIKIENIQKDTMKILRNTCMIYGIRTIHYVYIMVCTMHSVRFNIKNYR